MKWEVEWTNPASRDMRRVERGTARRVREAVLRLAETGHGDVAKLEGHDQEWRLRVGDYRVRLTFDSQARAIRVLRVLHRREAYQ